MFSSFERLVAWRYLRAKKSEGFVSVIAGFSFAGIMLGVATLIIVMSVMNGFRSELFNRILGLNGHMNVYAHNGALDNYDAMSVRLSGVQGVEMITPIIEGQSLVSSNGIASGVLVRGVDPADFQSRKILRESLIAGSFTAFEQGEIGVGKVLADKMNLMIGDQITLTSPQVKSTPFGSMPRQRSYNVGFIYDVGMYEYNSGFIFMPLKQAQAFFSMPGAVSALEVFLENPDRLDQVRSGMDLLLQGQARVIDWRQGNASFYSALKTERNVMFLILTMIILVAAFNIISSMIMLVKDKTHDIAILRTMGASRTSMLKIFMLTGASIGVMGTLFGAVLGISFALNIEAIRQFLEGLTGTELFSAEIYFLSQLPAEIDWNEVVTVLVMAFSLSILATIIPALRAARMNPVEALRYE